MQNKDYSKLISTFTNLETLMNTPLSFTVTVTSCMECKDAVFGKCCNEAAPFSDIESQLLYSQNRLKLTNTCPMIKESETK